MTGLITLLKASKISAYILSLVETLAYTQDHKDWLIYDERPCQEEQPTFKSNRKWFQGTQGK